MNNTLNIDISKSFFVQEVNKSKKTKEQKEAEISKFKKIIDAFKGKDINDVKITAEELYKADIKLSVSDFDNYGFNFKEYMKSDNKPGYLKSLYLIFDHEREETKKEKKNAEYERKPFIISYGKMASILNGLGHKCKWRGVKTAVESLVADGVVKKVINKDILTEDINGKIELVDEVTGEIKRYSIIKKQDFYNSEKWYFRSLEIDYNKLAELTCMLDEDIIHDSFDGKSRYKKFHIKTFVKAKAFVDIIFKKLNAKALKKYKEARELFNTHIWKVSNKYFKGIENTYLELKFVPAPEINLVKEQEKAKDKRYKALMDDVAHERATNEAERLQRRKIALEAKVKAVLYNQIIPNSEYSFSIEEILSEIFKRPLSDKERTKLDSYNITEEQLQDVINEFEPKNIKTIFYGIEELYPGTAKGNDSTSVDNQLPLELSQGASLIDYKESQIKAYLNNELTQKELAERLGCSIRTVYNIRKRYNEVGRDSLFHKLKNKTKGA